MNSKKCFFAMAVVAVVVCSVLVIIFVERNSQSMDSNLPATFVSTVAATQFVAEWQEDNQVSEIGISERTEQENEPITTEAPTDSQIITPSNIATQSEAFAKITIKTCEKTGTYMVMPDVNERTLKNNIGWLPSSSLPGEDGLCVLMGHRDTDFSILQYLKVGDEIIIEYGVSNYIYTVTKLKIIENDNELRFSVMSGSNLVLVTCYPFYYSGHAPKKIVINSVLINKMK